MSWFGDTFGGVNPVSMISGVGLPESMLIKNKNQENAAIDAQKTASMNPPSMLDPNSLPSNQDALDQRLNSASISPWTQMKLDQNTIGTQAAVDQAANQAGGQAAANREYAASHGGISGGSAETIGRNSGQDALMASQAAMREGRGNALGILGEGQKINQDNAGLWARMAEGENQNKVDVMKANQDLKGQIYGANQEANAQLEASKKKGLLGMGFLGL